MTEVAQKLIETLLESLLNNVKSGNCNLDDASALKAVDALQALNRNVYNITKRAACDRILHCSVATFELYRTMKLIPDGKHDYGSKELRWCENDFNEALAYRRKQK